MAYKIDFEKHAFADFEKLDGAIKKQNQKYIDKIEAREDPRTLGEQLHDNLSALWKSNMNFTFLKINRKEKLEHLIWIDVLIVTVIMFSGFIVTSFYQYFAYLNVNDISSRESLVRIPEFSGTDNRRALFLQAALLVLAFLYLWLRNFNFSQWRIYFNWKAIIKGLGLFLLPAFLFDLYFYLVYYIQYYFFNSALLESASANSQASIQSQHVLLLKLSTIDFSLILYSLLNGFYEEIFFLGICLSVHPNKRRYYFIYSILIRYAFHTYQGNVSAIGIAIFAGVIYYLFYTHSKDKNLLPFFIAHSITDVFGAGIINYFF